MHSKLHLLLPTRIQQYFTHSGLGDLASFLSQIYSTLYSTWTLLVVEIEKLLACVSCRCTITKHTQRKKKPKNQPTNTPPPTHNNKTLNVSLSFLLSSGQYHVHKVERDWKKGVEGNSDKKLFQVHWQVTYLRSEKKLHCTLYLKLGRKQIAAWTFFHVLKSFSQ